jgi:hypothetical protein
MRKTCFILAIIAASAAFLPGLVLGQSEVKLSSLSLEISGSDCEEFVEEVV